MTLRIAELRQALVDYTGQGGRRVVALQDKLAVPRYDALDKAEIIKDAGNYDVLRLLLRLDGGAGINVNTARSLLAQVPSSFDDRRCVVVTDDDENLTECDLVSAVQGVDGNGKPVLLLSLD